MLLRNPTVIGYHLVWTAYGWWLPNDPRGSMSHIVASDALKDLGELHYGRKKIQPASSIIRAFYDDAEDRLQHELLQFNEAARTAIGSAFAKVITKCNYTCYACAIMPDHIHLLIRKHKDRAETMIEQFQSSSADHLRSKKLCKTDHPVWGGPGWKVFLDSPEDVQRVMRYINDNPIKSRLPGQKWDFVKPYDGWSFETSKRGT